MNGILLKTSIVNGLLLVHFDLSAGVLTCPGNAFEVDVTSSYTGERTVSCTKKENGQYIKHGPEIIYAKDSSVMAQNYYVNNVLEMTPKADLPPQTAPLPVDNLALGGSHYVNQEFGFSISKSDYWHFLTAEEQKSIIKQSNTHLRNKKAMLLQVPANLVTIAKDKIFSRSHDSITFIPRISVSYIEGGTAIEICENFRKVVIKELINNEACIEKKLNSHEGYVLEFTTPIKLLTDQGMDLLVNFNSTITLWVISHKNKNLILFAARGNKVQFSSMEIDISNAIGSFKVF